MIDPGFGVHSDEVERQQPLAEFSATLPSSPIPGCAVHAAPSVIQTVPPRGVILWHHWGSETENHACLPAASDWTFHSIGCPGKARTCEGEGATAVLPTVSPSYWV